MAKVEMRTGDPYKPVTTVDLPGNSFKEKKEAEEKNREVKKIIKTSVVQKKKSLGRKFADLFIGEDVTDVKGYIIQDVIVPGIKNLITDVIQDGIEMIMFGEARGHRSRAKGNSTYVSYDKIGSRARENRDQPRRVKSGYEVTDIICHSRGEAEEVLTGLIDLVETYGEAKVADFYTMCDISGEFTDNYWGWTNLSTATVKRVREGYLIDLPRPEYLKR